MDLLKEGQAGGHQRSLPSTRQSVSQVAFGSNGMNLFAPPRCFDPNYPELMDRPGLDRVLLREELQILEGMNRRFGGHQLMLQYVQRLLSPTRRASLNILDLGTGIADIPRAIVAWARQRQLPVAITAVDGNLNVLQIAQESCRDWPEIRLERHDLLALPYAADSFDVVLCSLALHHFASADAVTILQRMQEMSRLGYVANDLRRNWLAIWSTELLTRTVIRSPIVCHDAPQSCRAAFTVRELRALAQQAGLSRFQINRHHWFFRMVLIGRK
jgi:2-polyprenyl-3-methyl-5-hydroxy-6-metoxy-1,4-benzoquinol methylase